MHIVNSETNGDESDIESIINVISVRKRNV